MATYFFKYFYTENKEIFYFFSRLYHYYIMPNWKKPVFFQFGMTLLLFNVIT